MIGEGIFRPISGDGDVPDHELRDRCVFWVRAIQGDQSNVACATGIGNRIIETPATCLKGGIYKIGAALAVAVLELGDDHPIIVFLMSAIEDLERLADA